MPRISRKIWADGHIHRSTDTYRGWAQQVAQQQHVGFVDLNEMIARRYDDLGQAAVQIRVPHVRRSFIASTMGLLFVPAPPDTLPTPRTSASPSTPCRTRNPSPSSKL
jgi:hypothetical protein